MDMSFVQADTGLFHLVHANIQPASFVEDIFIFPLYCFGFFVKNQVSVGVWVYFWVFESIPLINSSVSVPISWNFYFCWFFLVQLEVRDSDTARSFIVQD